MMARRAGFGRQLAWMLAIWALSVGSFAAAVYGFRGLMPGKPHAAAGAAQTGAATSSQSAPAADRRGAPPAGSADVR